MTDPSSPLPLEAGQGEGLAKAGAVHLNPTPAVQPDHAGRPGLDLLRLFSILCIVWFHAGGGFSDPLAFRLPAVALITSIVQTQNRRWNAKGVLLPWLFWAALYAVELAVRVYRHGPEVLPEWLSFRSVLLAGGTESHLWYAPFALLCGLVVHQLAGVERRYLWLLSIAVFALAYLARGWEFPFSQWALVLPAIFCGMLLAEEAILLDVLALSALGMLALGSRYVIAVPLVWVISLWRGPRFKWLATYSRAVYWSHPLVILVVVKVIGNEDTMTEMLIALFVGIGLMLPRWTRRIL